MTMTLTKPKTTSFKVLRAPNNGPVQPQACTCNVADAARLNAITANGDPTRTTTIRRAFAADATRRFKIIKRLITESIVANDTFGLVTPAPTKLLETLAAALPPRAFAFTQDSTKVDSFLSWLQGMIDEEVLSISTGPDRLVVGEARWSNIYIDSAYKKGMRRANAEMVKAGIIPKPEKALTGASLDVAFAAPINADAVGLIYTRVFEGLTGITDSMAEVIRGRLAQGLAEGRGPLQIARFINDAIEKAGGTLEITDGTGKVLMRSILRARTLARTEVIRAHHVAMINTYRAAGVEGVTVLAEWATAGDSRVCPDCAFMEGRILTLDEVEGLIPFHANCRCIGLPAVTKADQLGNYSEEQSQEFIGSNYLDKQKEASRRGFYEAITGRKLPGAPAPGVKVKAL